MTVIVFSDKYFSEYNWYIRFLFLNIICISADQSMMYEGYFLHLAPPPPYKFYGEGEVVSSKVSRSIECVIYQWKKDAFFICPVQILQQGKHHLLVLTGWKSVPENQIFNLIEVGTGWKSVLNVNITFWKFQLVNLYFFWQCRVGISILIFILNNKQFLVTSLIEMFIIRSSGNPPFQKVSLLYEGVDSVTQIST